MNVVRFVGAWVVVLGLAGCRERTINVNNTVHVTVHAGPNAGKAPATIDRNDPRIAIAQKEIEGILGRDVKFEVDAALVPHFDAALHEVFVEALETAVTSLQYLRERHPDLLAYAVAHWKTLRWKYTPSQQRALPQFDAKSGLLVVTVPPDDRRLLFSDTLATTFDRALDEERAARYEGVPPDAVPVDEHTGYFEYVTRGRVPPRADGTRVPREEVELQRLERVLGLYPRIRDEALRTKVQAWLVQAGSRLQPLVLEPPEEAELAALVRRLHPAWIAWLNANHKALSDRELENVAALMFRKHHLSTAPFRRGFDAVAFARPHVHAWVEAQRRTPDAPKPAREDLAEEILCPYRHDAHTGKWSFWGYCTGIVFADLAVDASGRKTLVRWLAAERSDVLTRNAVLHTLRTHGPDVIPPLVDALLAHPEEAEIAILALAEAPHWGRGSSTLPEPEALVRQVPRWWRDHPKLRAPLLYLLSELGSNYEGLVAWPKLPQFLGGKISAREFAAYLELGPRPLWSVEHFAASFSEGWQRSAVLVPALRHWLERYTQTGQRGPDPHYVTERVIRVFCAVGTERDYLELQAFLAEFLESHPSQRNNLNSFATLPGEQQCSKWRPRGRRGSASEPLFGD